MRTRTICIIITLLILSTAAVWCAHIMKPKNGKTAVISQDGKVLYRIDLSSEKDRTIEVTYNGRKNIIEIKDGRIRMKDADCPDHICVDTGWLEDGKPIVCLPNRLVIEYEESDIDGTAR
ncbi:MULTISPECIES: NusG domain II-containing protein [Ruminococcus]|uniref:Uncharacterized protein n=1 Tax=Ruminococcus albus (strain ATCC 27210 / DSM 20455 / JCM 14654 / NCDO 2250 / 7) TaxID=697329 RepID=E6UDP9_RUMA7|nr:MULTISPECIES: NusG domain II-containing protein [Ruminococcus]ADU20877.1 protein of unknown function DUF1312 [Ruminococcus albus 7 = DSM 20455]MCR5019800.1 NusG domain II-containing protein [Ruminococcus sp.]